MKVQRIRITFSITEAMRYTGHLALRLAWERTFRRARLPLAYSAGYTPRPQLNLAAPLPLGFLSTAELGDFWLEQERSLEAIRPPLKQAVPPGIEIHEVQEIPELHADKLPTLVKAASYAVTLPSPEPELGDRIASLMKETSLQRVRKGETYDLRPLIYELNLLPADEQRQRISMVLSHKPGKTGRPDEVLRQLGIDPNLTDICRIKIHLEQP